VLSLSKYVTQKYPLARNLFDPEIFVKALEEHIINMRVLQIEKTRENPDPFWGGYYCGLLDGIEASINIIKKIDQDKFKKKTKALLAKLKAAKI